MRHPPPATANPNVSDQHFTLRTAVKTLSEEPIAGLEPGAGFQAGSVRVSINQHGRYLVLKASDFASEKEAEEFIPRIKAGLWNLALEYNIAFIPDFERREITRSADREAAGRNLGATFGVADLGPVHGLTNEGGIVIYRSDEQIRFLDIGDITARGSTHLNHVIRVLTEGIEGYRENSHLTEEPSTTAFDLYLSHFYERSIRARFLTLVMTLEVLAPVTEKHVVAQELLTRLRDEIDIRLAEITDEEARDSLEALRRELEFRKETSIRRRVRRLILDEAPLDKPSRQTLAKQVVWAYDLRGALAHSGSVDSDELYKAHDIALNAAKLILRARLLGLARPLANPPERLTKG